MNKLLLFCGKMGTTLPEKHKKHTFGAFGGGCTERGEKKRGKIGGNGEKLRGNGGKWGVNGGKYWWMAPQACGI